MEKLITKDIEKLAKSEATMRDAFMTKAQRAWSTATMAQTICNDRDALAALEDPEQTLGAAFESLHSIVDEMAADFEQMARLLEDVLADKADLARA